RGVVRGVADDSRGAEGGGPDVPFRPECRTCRASSSCYFVVANADARAFAPAPEELEGAGGAEAGLMVVDRLTAAERRCRSRRRCKRQCDQQRREAGSEQQRETLTMSARHAVCLSVSDLLVASPAHLRSGADQSRYRRFARA